MAYLKITLYIFFHFLSLVLLISLWFKKKKSILSSYSISNYVARKYLLLPSNSFEFILISSPSPQIQATTIPNIQRPSVILDFNIFSKRSIHNICSILIQLPEEITNISLFTMFQCCIIVLGSANILFFSLSYLLARNLWISGKFTICRVQSLTRKSFWHRTAPTYLQRNREL